MASNITYDKKLEEMQKYLPFLRKIIEKLKLNNNNPDDHPRKGQLQKMEMLHNLLTSKEKKLKIDTLLKCEGVLIKLHSKMEKSNFFQNNSQHNASTPNAWSSKGGIANSKPSPVSISDDIIDITGPSSPPASPTAQNVPTMLPVEIPTERCDDAAIVVESYPKISHVNNEPQRGSQKNVQTPANVPPQEHYRHSSGSHSNTWHEKSSNRNAHKPLFVETAKKPGVPVDHLSSSHLNVKLNSPRPLTTTPTSSISSAVAASSSTHKSNVPFSRNRVGDVPPGEKAPPATPPLHGGTHSGAKTMYSPEESWNEIASNKATTTNVKSSHSKSAPVIDLSHDGSSTEKHFDNTYNRIIYQYKKSHNDGGVEVEKRFVENRKEEKSNLFSRFGSRVSTTPNSQFENFSVNAKNDRLKAAADTPMSFSSGAKTIPSTPAIPSTKLAQPQLADVLKSPPLSAQDISQLLDETVSGGVVEPIFAPQSISGIGTRRPPKPAEADIKATTPTSSLDMVRKKFAFITRNSPQFTDSPASPPPQHQPVTSSQTNERLALKYHPHPRAERTDAFPASPVYIESSSTHIRTDPRRNVMKSAPHPVPPVHAVSAAAYNVLPSINFNDPRLKKSALPQLPATNTSIPSLLSLQIAPPMPNFNPLLNTTPNVDARMQIKAPPPVMNNYPQTISQDPISKHVAPKINVDPMYKIVAAAPHIKPQMPAHVQPAASSIQGASKPMTQRKYSSDENWDSEPETGQPTLPAKPLLPTSNKPSLLPTPSALPAVMNKTPNTPIATKNTWQKTTAKAANSGYESEENWDSDPEPSCPVPVKTSTPLNFNATSKPVLAAESSQSIPPMYSTSDPRLSRVNAPPTHRAYSPRPHDHHSEITHSANPFSLLGEPRVGNVKTPLLPTPTNSNCNRFSALLNDQKERLKYLESKKQKHTPAQPRTYAEFKEAKARAAAEEAAAREAAAKEAAAKEAAAQRASTAANVSETSTVKAGASQKQQHQHNLSRDATMAKFDADKNKAFNKSKDMKLKDASLAQKTTAVPPPPETNLDKLYRGSNFESGAELVKTISNFKIPKKHVEKEVPKDTVVRPEEKSKDNIVEPVEKSVNEKKDEQQAEAEFENSIQNNEQEASEPTESEINDEQQETTHKNQVPKKKKINRTRKKKNNKNNIENTQAAEATEVDENSGENQQGATTETEDVVENQKKNVKRVGKKKTQKQQKAATAQNEDNTEISLSVNMDESAVSSSALAAGELTPTHSDQTKTEKELQFDELLQKLSPNSKALVGPSQQPQRIMRRRCTMIAYGSAPEVDKQKILSANALLFEDLQDREKLEQKAEEMKKHMTRKSKNLADMFQKTDDSCTVSTQNILSGKRRTRTKVNFNEVQRTIAVFKHKKVQDIKKEVKEDESSNVVVEVAATKKTTKKAAKSRQIVSEDQSCAVSSTTSQPEETASSSSNKVTKRKKIVNDGRDDEPSSSAKSSNSTPTPALDEEERKQEFLENFLRDLKDPNSNQEFILGLLSQILSNEKFQLVKKVLESKREEDHEEEEEDGTGVHAVEDADEEAGEVEAEVAVDETLEDKKDNKIEEIKKVTAAKRGRKQTKAIRKKRKNELDRLNLDIRDMFISEGVITATGRRMCTLAAVAEASTKADTSTVVNKRQNKKAPTEPAAEVSEVKSLPLRIRKSKVVISPLNLKLLHDSMPSKGNSDNSAHIEEEENDEKIEEEKDETSIKAKNKNKLKIKIESNENSQEADIPAQRKMPVLKPNTPIKLLEEEQQLEAFEEKIKPKTQTNTTKKIIKPKSKPCPKSKKPTMIVEPADDALASDNDTSGDSEDDIQLAHLRKRIKSSNDEVEQQPAEIESLPKLESGMEMNKIANTNLHWHALSKYAHWCVICDTRVLYVASHYKQHHDNCEHYASRMAPSILQQYKQGKLNVPLFGTSRRTQIYWFYRCPFCLLHNRNVTRGWMEHFITHTGEYIYECSNCHKGGNKQVAIDKHTKRVCPGATVLRNEYQLNHKTIKAHICHMCNFLQLNRYNLERHFIQQHGCDPENVTVLGYSIVLMNCTGVEVVSAEKAAELEAVALEKHTQESVVSIDDDDEKIMEAEEETLLSAKTVTPSKVVVKPKPKPASRKKAAKISMSNKKEISYDASETSLYPSAVLYSENVDSDSLTDLRKSTADAENDADRVAKFIADAQDDVLAAAEKAESEEKAREAALSSNIFMPTVRTNTDSPTIDCLTQSLRTIEQAEEELQQQQQQHMFNTSTPHQDTTTQVTGSKATFSASVMSMADRLSQRFKDIQEHNKTVASLTEQPTRVAAEKEQLSQDQQQSFSMTSVHSETASTSEGNLIIDEETQDKEATNEEGSVIELQEVDDTEDDGNWEDIEISETAPSGATNSGINNNKDKSKKKRIYQSLNRLYASLNKKGTNKQQTKKNPVIVSSTNKKPLVLQQPAKQQELEKSKAIDNQCLVPVSAATQSSVSNTRTLISNLQDLLPDSPCNDPMELVPELAPVEPLQDLNDISAILDANFNPMDSQSMLQQMDMSLPEDSICINAEGQQQSIQDALEFVTEQQKQDVEQTGLATSSFCVQLNAGAVNNASAPQQTSINRIQNLGYLKTSGGGNKFYCLTVNCNFMFSNDAYGLENHYLAEHSQMKWDGYCFTCNQQVMPQDEQVFTLGAEMQHMLKSHIEAKEPPSEDESNGKQDSMPRIKLRRLTGDCLSSTPTQLQNPDQILDIASNDITNMTLSDLLNAEPRPVNIKPTYPLHTQSVVGTADNVARAEQDALPLFKNMSSDFAITAVASVGTKIAVPSTNEQTPTECQLQISNVRSLNTVALNKAGATITQSKSDCPITLPKISNVCSLNVRAANSPKTIQWQQQVEQNESDQLYEATQDNSEVTGILAGALLRNNNNLGEQKRSRTIADLLRDDSPTLVAETVPVSTGTCGEFLITQTVSAQYDDAMITGNGVLPHLDFNISIAPNVQPATDSLRNNASIEEMTTVPQTVVTPIRAQFKCMGNGCKYQTHLLSAINKHLHFHESRNFTNKREYLRCCLCENVAKDVNDYIIHAKTQHREELCYGTLATSTNNGTANTSSKITQNVQKHLSKDSAINKGNNKGVVKEISTSNADEVPFRKQLEQTIKEIVEPTGLQESQLYRCVIDGCTTSLTEASFHTHIVYHLTTLGIININNYDYKCPHCSSVYHRPNGIKAHLKAHARHSYFCFVCMTTAVNVPQLLKHFCEKHWKVANVNLMPLLSIATSGAKSEPAKYFVAHGGKKLSPLDIQQFGEKLVSVWQNKKAASKTHFKPSEIKMLPMQPIFRNEVYCASCLYKTKVRTNMYRHLQMHNSSNASNSGTQVHVASVDPVNPVPCLNSNERHFDKMCNLASSSLVTGANASAVAKPVFKPPYVFIPDWSRLTCGVPGCQYLTVSEDIFRSHLSTLHQPTVQQYSCPFCKEELCTRSLNVERIIQHTRFHGQKLYQCEECDYLHYMKNVIERHINERHATLRVNLITHDRTVENQAEGTRTTQTVTGKKFKENTKPATLNENSNNSDSAPNDGNSNNVTSITTAKDSKLKWECDLCKHRTMTHNQMINHCNTKHSCKHQYQCVHCQFGSTQLAHIMTHIDDKHPAKTREARYIFHKIFSSAQEREADTRPLWQRDDPTRVRHIRGILMEDEEESEQYRKRLRLDEIDDDEDDAMDNTIEEELGDFVTLKKKEDNNDDSSDKPTTTMESNAKAFKFSCYHCDYRTNDFAELRNQHWQNVHNAVEQSAKPFYFRLLITLRCAECNKFTGDPSELQLHMQNVHKTRVYIAADADETKPSTCGYCDYTYPRIDNLTKHFQNVAHKPHDLKNFQSDQLATMTTLGELESYLQCVLCTDLFANRMAIVEHASTAHIGEDNFAFKELENSILYRCPICCFSATEELTTLRHMIDHYGAFKRCVFCCEDQASFNAYMQHCYTEHKSEIALFSKIYTLHEISKFLRNILVIFPNGLVINKKNLVVTPYGCNKLISTIYKEICKTAQEPPIPRLSIARLVARKSIEAKASSGFSSSDEQEKEQTKGTGTINVNAPLQTHANVATKQAKKIAKRRQTVAYDVRGDFKTPEVALFNSADDNFLAPKKKRKTSENILTTLLPPPTTAAPPAPSPPAPSPPVTTLSTDEVAELSCPAEPYSFYGKEVEPMDLSKIYTKVAIGGGIDTPLTIEKFKMLFKIETKVVLEKLDYEEIRKQLYGSEDEASKDICNYEQYQHVKKACPASHKKKYI